MDMTTPARTANEYVSLAAAAALAGVDPKTIRRWIASGRLTGYRLGPRLIRVSTTELESLMRPIPTIGAR